MIKDKKQIAMAVSFVLLLSTASGAISFVQAKSNQVVPETPPDGYALVDSVKDGNNITHTYEQPGPAKVIATQSPDETFAKYIDALPPERTEEGVLYRQLLSNSQNMKLAVQLAQLEVAKREAEADLARAETRLKEISAETQNNTVTTLGDQMLAAQQQALASGSQVNESTTNADYNGVLDLLVVQGVFLSGQRYVARIMLPDGNAVTAPDNSKINGGISVKAYDNRVVLSKGENSRTIHLVR